MQSGAPLPGSGLLSNHERGGFDCSFCTPLACMVSVDQVQIVDASTRLLASIWFSRPRLLTVVPYSPSLFSHPRFTPARDAMLMRSAAEFDNPLSWVLLPKRSGPTCSPTLSPPACVVCAPTYWQAMTRLVGLCGWPIELLPYPARPAPWARMFTCMRGAPVINSRRISRCPIFEVRPRICLPPVDFCRGTSPHQATNSRPFANSFIGGAKA